MHRLSLKAVLCAVVLITGSVVAAPLAAGAASTVQAVASGPLDTAIAYGNSDGFYGIQITAQI